jgi:hypothetical protein
VAGIVVFLEPQCLLVQATLDLLEFSLQLVEFQLVFVPRAGDGAGEFVA